MDDKRAETLRLALAAARRGSRVAYVCAYQESVTEIVNSDLFCANLKGAREVRTEPPLFAFDGGGGIFFVLDPDSRAGMADRCYMDPEISDTVAQKEARRAADGYVGQSTHWRKVRREEREANA